MLPSLRSPRCLCISLLFALFIFRFCMFSIPYDIHTVLPIIPFVPVFLFSDSFFSPSLCSHHTSSFFLLLIIIQVVLSFLCFHFFSLFPSVSSFADTIRFRCICFLSSSLSPHTSLQPSPTVSCEKRTWLWELLEVLIAALDCPLGTLCFFFHHFYIIPFPHLFPSLSHYCLVSACDKWACRALQVICMCVCVSACASV